MIVTTLKMLTKKNGSTKVSTLYIDRPNANQDRTTKGKEDNDSSSTNNDEQ